MAVREYIETSVAASILGVTPASVRLYQKNGRLRAAVTTARNQRLYARHDVERLRDQREREQKG